MSMSPSQHASTFESKMEAITSYLLRYRFFLLSLLLVVLMVSHTLNGQWSGDFWEHSAAVRELATHPFSPHHPQLLLRVPHAFYSPYTLGVACVSRLTGLGPVESLAIAGIFNLLLFLFALRLFVSLLFPQYGEATAFYTLLFTLVLWGGAAWGYSGFFHLRVLGYVLPYPSTFATAVVLIALSMYILLVRNENRLWLIPILVASLLVILTHPLTFMFMAAGLVSLSFGQHRLRLLDYGLLIGLFILTFLIAAIWPYFPFVTLITSESAVYHESNRVMYVGVIERILPALIGFPLLLLRIKSNRRDALVFMFATLCLIYLYGVVSNRFSYGRVISYIVLILHISIAAGVSHIESKLAFRHLPPSLLRFAYFCLILVITLAFSFQSMIQPTLPYFTPGRPNTYHQYLFLSDLTPQYDVVLSDIDTSWVVPTFGGKVIACQHALAFVPDHDTRRKDVSDFFRDATALQERLEIIRKYQVNFLLIDKARIATWRTMVDSFQPFGRVVFDNDQFVLIHLHSSTG